MAKLVFHNFGGSYQLKIENAEDLEKIQELDETLWAATSVPISNLHCDKKFLTYLDTDKNGRIRTDELKTAQSWLFQLLKNRNGLTEGSDILRLDDIDTSHEEGQKILKAAELILNNLNTPLAKTISLAQIQDEQHIMASAVSNGDGIISPVLKNKGLCQFIQTVMDTIGSVQDASEKQGINQEHLEEFFHQAEAYLEWQKKGEIPKSKKKTEIMFWGVDTPPAYELLTILEKKIDQYFLQCSIVKFDERTKAFMQFQEKEFEEINFRDRDVMKERLKNMSLAIPDPKGELYLDGIINPLYKEKLSDFKIKVIKPALGKVNQLTYQQWEKLKDIFKPYSIWWDSKKGEKVEKLGIDKLHAFIKGPYKKKVSKLITQDLAIAESLKQIENLEKLIYYQKLLLKLSNNFINFSDLYNPECRSLFEAGTLIIDGRIVTFTLRIQDREAHKKIAKNSCMYLLYLEIIGHHNQDSKFEIVAAVTSGTADGLHIGKTGIFFTIDGKEWDARVIDILVNPISPWESVKAPFLKIKEFITKQTEKFNKQRETKLETSLTSANPSNMMRDLLLGGGIAIAALGSAFAYITKALSQVKILHFLGVIGGIVAIILIPSMIMGFAKIRKRDISVILEAAGFSVNLHMRLNAIMGKLFTHTSRLPKGSRKQRKDMLVKFVKKFGYHSFRSKKIIIILLMIIFIAGILILLFMFFPESMSFFKKVIKKITG